MEERCGYCRTFGKNGTVGKLVPVILTTRGVTRKSWSHLRCMFKWQKVSDVRIDEQHPEKYIVDDAVERLSHYRKKSILDSVLYRKKKDNRCKNCGYPISPESTYCNNCAGEERGKMTREQVENMRSLRGVYTQEQFAEMYGVSRSAVIRAMNGQTWK